MSVLNVLVVHTNVLLYIRLGAPLNFQGGGGSGVFFEINNFGQTLHEINNLFQEMFYMNM